MAPFPELPFSLALCPWDEWRRNGKQHSEKHVAKAQDVRAQETLHNYLLLAHSPFSPQLSHRALMLLTENDSPLLIAHLELNPNPEHIQHLLPTLTCSCFNCLRGGEVTSANQAKILWEYARGPDNKLSNVLFLHQFHVKLNNVNNITAEKLQTKDKHAWRFPEALRGMLVSTSLVTCDIKEEHTSCPSAPDPTHQDNLILWLSVSRVSQPQFPPHSDGSGKSNGLAVNWGSVSLESNYHSAWLTDDSYECLGISINISIFFSFS